MSKFKGFPKDFFAFFNELKKNNNRDWFNANKDRYLARNNGYMYRSYAEVFRRYLLKPKDPVPHPLWRRG